MRTRKLILLFVFFGFMPLISIGAQTAAPAAASTTQPNPPAAKSSGPTDLYQILRDERKTLERQADRHVQSMKDPYDRALYLIASLLGVGLILFGYLSWKTKEEMRTEVRRQMQNAVDAAVEQEASRLKHRLQMLNEEVDDLTAYRSRKVLGVTPLREDDRIEPFISVFRAFSVSQAERINAETPNVVRERNPDLAILSFDATEGARSLLQWLVSELKTASPRIPLLIFSYSFGSEEIRLGKEEFGILKGFEWYLPANVPATLIAQAISLLKRGRDRYGDAPL